MAEKIVIPGCPVETPDQARNILVPRAHFQAFCCPEPRPALPASEFPVMLGTKIAWLRGITA
jgi:hypothetical protein